MSKNLTMAEAARHLSRFTRDMKPYAITWGDMFRVSPDESSLTRLRNIRSKLDANIARCNVWLRSYKPGAMEEYMVKVFRVSTENMRSYCDESIERVEDFIARSASIEERVDGYLDLDGAEYEIPF